MQKTFVMMESHIGGFRKLVGPFASTKTALKWIKKSAESRQPGLRWFDDVVAERDKNDGEVDDPTNAGDYPGYLTYGQSLNQPVFKYLVAENHLPQLS